jgi:N-methylhydantoinase A/oxoprolinase/acetone carboxylase beta subunit
VEIHNFILHAVIPIPKPELQKYPLCGNAPSASAVKKTRPVYWPEFGDFRETHIYEESGLDPGNVVAGPAIIEAPNTTTVIPPGWTYSVNEFRAGILNKE